MKTNSVPKIRFKGFTDDWEQRKLGEVGIAKSGVGFPDTEQGGVEGIPFFKVSDMNIKGNENELVAANNYVTVEQISRKKWNVINDVPAIFFAKVGAAVMLNRKRLVRFPFLLDNNTMAYIFNKNVWDCDFGKTLFETLDLTKLTQVGALPSYNASDVENIRINIPNKGEQQKIGEYFSNLDRLITLHQRKCDQTKELKKFMLQKMFPKKGEKNPEIRFSGFTDDWEQREYSDIATTRRGLTYKPSDITDGGKRVLRSSNINEDNFEIHNDDVFVDEGAVNIPYVKNGDILITSANGSSRLVGKHAIIHDIPDNCVVHGGFMLIASSDEPEFVNTLMSSQWYTKFINVYVAGGNGAIGNLNKNDLDEQIVLVPSKKERKKIGNYFSNLDRLITLHQRKCEQLKELKKFMLQNMFPKKG
ncbi:restriction endonuclease subunit S [Streptococcus gallolyticus]|uniref:restriction endonuclease subunit S n=1 Tax=Streptococcus gallolyticus TaxID=315405 RepID=UPI00088D561A|nr:restriction endonuclease subunit S [Streptococcus gallolyticus]SDJ69833.1 type I restriction enzyme, S subunit [Streptococcus gallolyticus]SDL19902.1 type I restriction enzyme, S subunit [Streptococcus gallolyticus]